MPKFTKGTCHHGIAIFRDGKQMTAEEVLDGLRTLNYLNTLKKHKDENGKDEHYLEEKQEAWAQTRRVLGLQR